jgi:hypothetical protein
MIGHLVNRCIEAVLIAIESPAHSEPTIKFLLFIPSKSHSPLHLLTYEGTRSKHNAFVIPRWGGVLTYNLQQNDSFIVTMFTIFHLII